MKLEILKQKVDYDKIVTGKDLDIETYNNKFEMWDYVMENNLFQKQDSSALMLLNDTTLYSYAFLKDNKGNRFKMTVYQDAIVNCVHDFSDNNPNRIVMFKASNQIGKSAALIAMAIHKVTTESNINVIMVSRALPQSQYLLAQIRQMLNNSVFENWREDIGETANTTHITFQREGGKIVNRIICAPCGEGLLGYPVHYLYLDEIDFYEESKRFFWQIAYPRTLQTKGQIIMFSNPNPYISRQSSILWDLWNGEHSNFVKRKFTFNFLDAPWNTREKYESDRRNVPSFEFESTHNGDFPIDSGGFFTQKEITDMTNNDFKNELPIVDRPVFIGLDVAKMRDRSVLSLGVLRPNKDDPKLSDLDVRYFKHFPEKTDYDIVVETLKQIVEWYTKQQGVAAVGLDVSGVGRAVSDFCKANNIKATDVKFTLENKSRLYANFKLLAEQRRIKIVYDEDCVSQMSTLMFRRTPAGYLGIHHEKESMKDDFPDSICALIDVSIMPSKIPVAISFVPHSLNEPENIKTPDLRQEVERKTILANRPSYYGEFEEFGGEGW